MRDVRTRWGLRCQPPVLSPIPFSALSRAATAAVAGDPFGRLDRLLRAEYAADGVLLTGSGKTALELAIRAAAALNGSPALIALPAFGCFDLATALVGAGARATLYDLDPDTLAPDLDSLVAAIRRGASAVVITPLYGVPLDWERLEVVAAAHGALLIEDAAQGHGATWNGRPLGSLGRLSILSFGRGKGWTGGGGGALLWRRLAMPDAVLRQVGPAGVTAGTRAWVAAAAQALLARPAIYGVPAAIPWLGLGETRYYVPSHATSAPAITASLVLATRDASLSEAAERRRRGDWLLARLPDGLTTPAIPAGGTAGWLRLPLRIADAAGTVMRLRRLGVASSYPTTLAALPQLQPLLVPGTPAEWPGAGTLVRELITLPTHSRLTDAELELLARSLAGHSGEA